MCNSDSKEDRRCYTKAGNLHEEKGGFHVVKLNSPINLDGKTIFFIILALLAIGGYYIYRKDKHKEHQIIRQEKAKEEEKDKYASGNYT